MSKPLPFSPVRLASLVVLLACLCGLTGCINVEEELTISKNGSVEYSGHLTLGMTKMLGMMGGMFGGEPGAKKTDAPPMDIMEGLDPKTLQKDLKKVKSLEKKIKGLKNVNAAVWMERGVLHMNTTAACATMAVCKKFLDAAQKQGQSGGMGGGPMDMEMPRADFSVKGGVFRFRLPLKKLQKSWQEKMKNNPFMGGMGHTPGAPPPLFPPPGDGAGEGSDVSASAELPLSEGALDPTAMLGPFGDIGNMMTMFFASSHYRVRVNLPGAPQSTDAKFRPNSRSVVWELPLSDLFASDKESSRDFSGMVKY